MKYLRASLILIFFLANPLQSLGASDNLLEYSQSEIPVADIKKADESGIFSLSTIVDGFLNYDFEKQKESSLSQREAFVDTILKFNQGNVVVAYDEFEELLGTIKSDYALLVWAKSMYEIGLFSLGDKALDKIEHKTYLNAQILDLKKAYCPKNKINKNEEIYLAKTYSSIYFDNSAQEAAFELNKQEELLKKSDYANYVLSQALFETRQYKLALNALNHALSLNPDNLSYKNFKLKTLNKANRAKEALKLIEQSEISNEQNLVFKNNHMVQKQEALSLTTNKESDKKYYLAKKTFLEGDYQGAKNECKNILSFDKNNYKVLTLLALSEMVLGDLDEAQKHYNQSYLINKNYAPTLSGLGDLEFLNSNFKNAQKYYTKAISADKNDQTTLLKLALIYKNQADKKALKKLEKIEKKLEKMEQEPYLSYHAIAATILQNNPLLKGEYVRKASVINPLYENGWVALLEWELENKKYENAKNFLYMISFANGSNYVYFYLNALYDIALGKKNEAIINLKNCLSLNPQFQDASRLLLEILPTKLEDFSTNQGVL